MCDRVLGLALCHSRENLERKKRKCTEKRLKRRVLGLALSPLATRSKNRNSEALTSLFGTGDFEQLSSEIARKEVKCHLRLLQEVVHQNKAQESGIVVRQSIVILVVPVLVRATRIVVLKSST